VDALTLEVPDGLAWVWRFPVRTPTRFASRLAPGSWRAAARTPPTVTVVATREAWAGFLTTPRGKRRLRTEEISVEGSQAQRVRFASAFAAKISTR
jgi:hypothetical protein